MITSALRGFADVGRIEFLIKIRFSGIAEGIESSRGSVEKARLLELPTATANVVAVTVEAISYELRSACLFVLEKLEDLVVQSRHPFSPIPHPCGSTERTHFNAPCHFQLGREYFVRAKLNSFSTLQSIVLCMESFIVGCNGSLLRTRRYGVGPSQKCGPGASTPVRVGSVETGDAAMKDHDCAGLNSLASTRAAPHTDQTVLTDGGRDVGDLEALASALADATRPRCEHGHDGISLNLETGRPDCPVPEHDPARIIDIANATTVWTRAADEIASTTDPHAQSERTEVRS